MYLSTQRDLRTDEHPQGRCCIYTAEHELGAVLQGPVHRVSNGGGAGETCQIHDEMEDQGRLQVHQVDTQGLDQERKMVVPQLQSWDNLRCLLLLVYFYFLAKDIILKFYCLCLDHDCVMENVCVQLLAKDWINKFKRLYDC